MGWTEAKIGEYLGMELDEIIRLKQISGLKQAFQNHTFSKSWAKFERKYYNKYNAYSATGVYPEECRLSPNSH